MNELRFAGRTLGRTPTFTVSAVLVLAIGIGANTAVFSALNTLLWRPLPYRDADRLVMIGDVDLRTGLRAGTSLPTWTGWERRLRSLEAIAAVEPGVTLPFGRGREYVSAARATTNFFAVVGVTPIVGRAFVPADGSPGAEDCVVVSHEFWRRRLGASLEVGSRPVLLGGRPHAVVGVLPPGFRLPFTRHDLWLPVKDTGVRASADRSFQLLARLRGGVTVESARRELRVVAQALEHESPATRRGWGLWLQTMRQVTVGQRGPLAGLLAATVGLVLLIACFNIATLQLARITARGRELAVRLAIGATRWDLVRLSLAEGLLVAAAGAMGGVLLTFAVRQLALASVPELADMVIDVRVLAFTMALGGLSAVVFSTAPAVLASRAGLAALVSAGALSGPSHGSRLQRAFVTAQTAGATALLAGAGVLISALAHLTALDPGFRCDQILAAEIRLPAPLVDTAEGRRQVSDRLAAGLASIAGVSKVASASSLPFFGVDAARFQIEGREAPAGHPAGVRAVTASYFDVYGIPVRAGRTFSDEDDEAHPPVAIVNERMARLAWPSGRAIGSRVRLGHEWITIVGIAADVRSVGLRQPVLAELFRPLRQAPPRSLSFALRTRGEPLSYVPAVRGVVNGVHGEAAVQYVNSMAALLEEQLTLVRWLTVFGTVFACIALALAAVGLYGVIACQVARRTPEIGLRVALGADRAAILRLVLASGARTIAAGLALGALLAAALTQLLRAILLEAGSPPAGAFVAVALVLVSIDLCAMWVPARHAARVDPVVALRQE